jgi:hypothetical protein
VPLDPHLDAIARSQPDASQRAAARFADIEKRLRALEASSPAFQLVAGGAPTSTPREGTPAAESGTPRLWLYIDGSWRFANLT